MLSLLLVAAALAQDATPEPVPVHMSVTLSDGQVLVGQVLRQDDGDIELTLSDGVRFQLPAEAVAKLAPISGVPGEDGSLWGIDPNRSRYLYSPTAFSLGQGNGYLAQRALVLTSVAVGVTDFLDVEAGTVLPLLVSEAALAAGGVKVAGRVTHGFRLGAGSQVFIIPEADPGALVFGTATVGDADTHGSISSGAAIGFGEGEALAWISTVGGNHRLGPKTALITENWVLVFLQGDGPWGGPLFVVPSGGVRLFGPNFAVDLALVPIFTGEREVPVVPGPWVSFAWNWSLKKTDTESP